MANERRLIDADALSRQMQEKADRMITQGRYTPAQDYMFVATVVDNAPTVDAVDVVRCKDCYYFARWADGGYINYCDKYSHAMRADDFCSYGERRSGTQPQREET